MTPLPRLVILGSGGHARVVADIVRREGRFEIAGFLDDVNRDRHGQTLAGAPILGGRERVPSLRGQGVEHAIVAIGDCPARVALAGELRQAGLRLATALHPAAVIASDATIGDGTVVAAGAIVNPNCRVGENVIVNTAASVDHDGVVEEGAHLSPGVRLAGRVTIGRGAWVGIGAIVIDGIRIGARAVVGAGAVVVRDLPSDVLAYGVPARVVRPLSR